VITAMFTRGDLRILVGTQSRLGEGWDAPVLNSLVLASNTASFMLSNQMRGRTMPNGQFTNAVRSRSNKRSLNT